MAGIKLGIKQRENNNRFVYAFDNIKSMISKAELDNRIDKTLSDIKKVTGKKKVGYAWSGGKDSVALKFFMDALKIETSVIGLTEDLEYPKHLQWVTDNMPDGIEVFNSGLNLEWLSNNLQMLFPQDSRMASRWFKLIQHKAQEYIFRKHKLDIIVLGRRVLDSNYIGTNGDNIYTTTKGITRYSPLSDWPHEMVLALIKYYNLPHSPIYSWINGYVVGTGCWPARQWTGNINKAWDELYIIDPSIVEAASLKIKSAKTYLQNK